MDWFLLSKRIPDEWLTTRWAARVFLLATLLIPMVAVDLIVWIIPLRMPTREWVEWSILALADAVAILFLWFGMWRYWAKLDPSKTFTKRLWFPAVALGLWWGSCLYCHCMYLPQVRRQWEGPTSMFQRVLIAVWMFLLLIFIMAPLFPHPIIRHLLQRHGFALAYALVPLVLVTFAYPMVRSYRAGIARAGKR